LAVPAIVCGLVLATVGVEEVFQYASRSTLVNREDSITLHQLVTNRQTGIFFTFLMVMTITVQEPVLEPYGKEVLG